jgi:hypothetical protein
MSNHKYTLYNKGQGCKIGPVKGSVLAGGGREVEMVKECEYSTCILYTVIKLEKRKRTLLKSFLSRRGGG